MMFDNSFAKNTNYLNLFHFVLLNKKDENIIIKLHLPINNIVIATRSQIQITLTVIFLSFVM